MSLRAFKGAFHRRRRALRRAMLEPLLVGRPTLRDTVMNALAARGHLVFCDLGDARFFVDPGDRVVGAWSMWHGGWQRAELDRAIATLTAQRRLAPGAIFVDVGANIGTHVVYAMRSGVFARAVAFEPEPRNLKLLEMNLAANAVADKVTVLATAAGAATGVATLHLHPRNKGAHTIGSPPADDAAERVEVTVVRVEDALAGLGIAPAQVGLLWVDVEGYEPQVFAGLAGLMAQRVPIAFEYSPDRYSSEDRRALVQRLTQSYAAMQILTPPESATTGIAAIEKLDRAADVLVF